MSDYNKYGKQLFIKNKALKILEKGKGEKDSYGDQIIKLSGGVIALQKQVKELKRK